MALIDHCAGDEVRANARTCLALIGPRASIAVVTRRASRSRRIGTSARRRIACARNMALVRRRANYGSRADACSRLASIGRCASVAVVAARSIGHRVEHARAADGIAARAELA